MKATITLVILVLVASSLACGSEAPSGAQAPGSEPTAPQAESPASTLPPTSPPPTRTSPPPTPTADPNLVAVGTHIVGTDIQPGLYKGAAGTDLFSSCYWARLKDLSGQFEALISNDNSIGQYYIQVLDNDFALQSDCEIVFLEELPPAPATFPAELTPGTYLVGIDIQPGTYQGHAGTEILESCYWSRLSGVTGAFSDLIANANATGQYYVQLSPTDFAFHTACALTRVAD